MKNKKAPEIRFKGFMDEWKCYSLFEIAEYRNGKAHENDIDEKGKFIVVNSKFVSTNGKIKKYSNQQNEPLFKDEIAFVLSDVPNGRALAKTFLIDESGRYTLNQRIAGITPHPHINSSFLSVSMNRNKYFMQYDDGVKQTNLSIEDMKKYENYYPSELEQEKIGEFFQSIQHVMTLYQYKCDKLMDIKKSLLEKMFPKKDEKTPEIRFKGFTDLWKQYRVHEIFKITRGYVLPSNKTVEFMDQENKYPVYSSQTLKNGLMGYYKEYLYDTAITWTTDGANAGTVRFRPGKFYCTNVCGVLLSQDGYSNKMVSEALNNVAFRYVSKVGNPKLMNNVMSDIEIKLPNSILEQDKMSLFLTKLDALILLYQSKLNKLNIIKEAMIEKMLI